jgi:hypothetical protein
LANRISVNVVEVVRAALVIAMEKSLRSLAVARGDLPSLKRETGSTSVFRIRF